MHVHNNRVLRILHSEVLAKASICLEAALIYTEGGVCQPHAAGVCAPGRLLCWRTLSVSSGLQPQGAAASLPSWASQKGLPRPLGALAEKPGLDGEAGVRAGRRAPRMPAPSAPGSQLVVTFLEAHSQALTVPCKSPSLPGLLWRPPWRAGGSTCPAHGAGTGHAAAAMWRVAETGWTDCWTDTLGDWWTHVPAWGGGLGAPGSPALGAAPLSSLLRGHDFSLHFLTPDGAEHPFKRFPCVLRQRLKTHARVRGCPSESKETFYRRGGGWGCVCVQPVILGWEG